MQYSKVVIKSVTNYHICGCLVQSHRLPLRLTECTTQIQYHIFRNVKMKPKRTTLNKIKSTANPMACVSPNQMTFSINLKSDYCSFPMQRLPQQLSPLERKALLSFSLLAHGQGLYSHAWNNTLSHSEFSIITLKP